MSPADQPEFPFTPGGDAVAAPKSEEELRAQVREAILNLIAAENQPSAGELLTLLEEQFGWWTRTVFMPIVQALRSDLAVREYLREYLKITLTDEELAEALRGGAKPEREFTSSIDELLQTSALYRKSAAFRDAIEFTAKFRDYAPFNNMLVRVQNPSCGFYATARDWRNRFKREIKEDARPLLILAPMHPVMLVYDLDATEGEPLPEKFESFAKAEGEFEDGIMARTLENAERMAILVQRKPLSTTHGGFATTRLRDGRFKIRVAIHDKLDAASAYSVLCHELAHILLGHLGSDADGWWPSRINLSHATVEIEAEAVSFIVCQRIGLKSSSAAYLASFLADGAVPASVSMELISKVAGRIEEMGKRLLPEKLRKSAKKKP